MLNLLLGIIVGILVGYVGRNVITAILDKIKNRI